jgi:hypothetical protein
VVRVLEDQRIDRVRPRFWSLQRCGLGRRNDLAQDASESIVGELVQRATAEPPMRKEAMFVCADVARNRRVYGRIRTVFLDPSSTIEDRPGDVAAARWSRSQARDGIGGIVVVRGIRADDAILPVTNERSLRRVAESFGFQSARCRRPFIRVAKDRRTNGDFLVSSRDDARGGCLPV